MRPLSRAQKDAAPIRARDLGSATIVKLSKVEVQPDKQTIKQTVRLSEVEVQPDKQTNKTNCQTERSQSSAQQTNEQNKLSD
ncbi:hypothetical protein B0A80_11630 [Flavobacterium tructae]|nr:hypothetical protein B0A80_11630 [Flavobacterium tructae]